MPESFRSQPEPVAAQPSNESLADQPWWTVFNDPSLQQLIAQTLESNHDLQIAVARIEQARALVGIERSRGLPQVGYGATAEGGRSFVPLPGGPAAVTYGAFSGLINAMWEIDLWGRIHHSTEAARANLLAQEDVRRGVLLTLVTDAAAGYFQLLVLDRELAIAQESANTYKQTFDLFNTRFKGGRDSELPVQRAQANYNAAISRIEELGQAIAQQENALSILAGGYPNAITRGRVLSAQTMPRTPVGSTTELLQRRPDIAAAEHQMMVANEEIGIAVADYFPRIGLGALAGGLGVTSGGDWHGFGVWSAALSAAGPIYSGGRLREAYLGRQAYWDETVAQYKKTVLVAFQETSNALVAQQALTGQRAAQEAQVAALRRSADLALNRYDAGRASYFEVLEANQQLFPAQDALARTQRDQLIAVINLYKALGGGWKLTPAEWSPTH